MGFVLDDDAAAAFGRRRVAARHRNGFAVLADETTSSATAPAVATLSAATATTAATSTSTSTSTFSAFAAALAATALVTATVSSGSVVAGAPGLVARAAVRAVSGNVWCDRREERGDDEPEQTEADQRGLPAVDTRGFAAALARRVCL